MKKLTVLIPCYNKEKAIGKVIDAIPYDRFKRMDITVQVLVVDNNSKDKTSAVARKHGATVLFEKKQGKGNAIRFGWKHIPSDTDFVVMLDGDNTYLASEMVRLVEPLDSGFADVVMGSRMIGKRLKHSMTRFNRLGNWGFTFLVRIFVHGNVTDVLTGYFAWKKKVVDDLSKYVEAPGFSLEMEMVCKTARLGHYVTSVPITYTPRDGATKLRPIHDGLIILRTFLRYMHWRP